MCLAGQARWDWTHGIDGVDADIVDGRIFPRVPRLSVTFRKLKETSSQQSLDAENIPH